MSERVISFIKLVDIRLDEHDRLVNSDYHRLFESALKRIQVIQTKLDANCRYFEYLRSCYEDFGVEQLQKYEENAIIINKDDAFEETNDLIHQGETPGSPPPLATPTVSIDHDFREDKLLQGNKQELESSVLLQALEELENVQNSEMARAAEDIEERMTRTLEKNKDLEDAPDAKPAKHTAERIDIIICDQPKLKVRIPKRTNLLRFTTRDYSDVASPRTLIMQDCFDLEVCDEIIKISMEMLWSEKCPSMFRICFPQRQPDAEFSFYGELDVSVEFMNVNGNPAFLKCITIDAMNGTCVGTTRGQSHDRCLNPTYVCSSFLTDEERNLFKDLCMRKKRRRPNRVTFFLAHVSVAQKGVTSGEDIFKDVVDIGDLSCDPHENKPSKDTSGKTSTSVTSTFSCHVKDSKQECVPDDDTMKKLSASARKFYSEWMLGVTEPWTDDIDVNLVLYELACDHEMTDLKSLCRQHIMDSSKLAQVTNEQYIATWTVAYKYNDPLLLELVAEYINKCSFRARENKDQDK